MWKHPQEASAVPFTQLKISARHATPINKRCLVKKQRHKDVKLATSAFCWIQARPRIDENGQCVRWSRHGLSKRFEHKYFLAIISNANDTLSSLSLRLESEAFQEVVLKVIRRKAQGWWRFQARGYCSLRHWLNFSNDSCLVQATVDLASSPPSDVNRCLQFPGLEKRTHPWRRAMWI